MAGAGAGGVGAAAGGVGAAAAFRRPSSLTLPSTIINRLHIGVLK